MTDPYAINERLLHQNIIGGFPLKKFYPELGNASLWCATETTTKASIAAAAAEVAL
jgi:glycine dehydrogenase subunit 1